LSDVALSYVLPVHNDANVLERNVDKLARRLSRVPLSEIVLVENGSRDASWEVCEQLAGDRHGVRVLPFREPNAGLGYAYARGVKELVDRHGPSHTRWAFLTGTDLPFEFTDLDNALPHLGGGRTRAVAGSKAHRRSDAWAGAQRYVMSIAYRNARRAILGMRIGDSQGSFALRLDLLATVGPLVRSRDFFYTTELAYLVEKEGEPIVEVPVVLEAHQLVRGNSTIKPLRDARRMLTQMVELRRR